MFSKILAFVAFSMVLASANAQNCARAYAVAPGDTCDSIGATQHVSTYQLTFVNPQLDANCSNLPAGEPLCLGIVGQDCTTTTVVKAGDNCATIEAAAGISDSVLKANNPNINNDCSNIYAAEVLCTDSKVFNYTSTA